MNDAIRLDKQYFIDPTIYDCPFCDRRHVGYANLGSETFNWSKDKACTIWRVKCNSCLLVSMHLTFQDLQDETTRLPRFRGDVELDAAFFISVPTSFFVIDRRIPRVLREIITEAEGCAKMNLLTGASACARKAVFELFAMQKIDGTDYASRIGALAVKFPGVDKELFEVLGQIEDMTREKMQEQSWAAWDAKHLHVILQVLKTALHEMYVAPDESVTRVTAVRTLRESLVRAPAAPDRPGDGGTAAA
jgi:hypothetical protein